MRRELRDEGSKVRQDKRVSKGLVRLVFQVNKDYKLVLLKRIDSELRLRI